MMAAKWAGVHSDGGTWTPHELAPTDLPTFPVSSPWDSTPTLPIGYAVAGPLVIAIGPRAMLWGAAVAALVLPLANLGVHGVRRFPTASARAFVDPETS